MASTGSTAAAGRPADSYNRRNRRTPAQWYCMLAGLSLLLAGIGGFFSDATFDAGTELQGDTFLGFEVNGWHNLVHIASGLVLLAASPKRASARATAIGFGLVYGVVTVIGLIDGSDVLGILPVNPADNMLHIALSVLGLVAGFMSRSRDDVPRDEPRTVGEKRFESERSTRTGVR